MVDHEKAEPKLLDVSDIPDSVNWVEKGSVNAPFTQGVCSAGHAFASMTSIEAAYLKKYGGSLIKLSEQ
jgi:hypothetical protein